MNQAESFIERGFNPSQKWNELKVSEYPSILEGEVFTELTPFSNTEIYNQLTKSEQKNLYLEFSRLNTEMVLYFEDVFGDNFVEALKKETIFDDSLKAAHILVDDEKVHSEAFMDLMLSEQKLGWYYKNTLLNSKLVKRFSQWLVSHEPIAAISIGARLEAYGIQYAKFLKKICGSYSYNRHTQVHYLHMLDEVHHVGLQMQLFEETMAATNITRRIKVTVATSIYKIFIKSLLLKSSFEMISRSLPQANIIQKMGLTYRLFDWWKNQFAPTRESKTYLASLTKGKSLELIHNFARI